MGTMGERIRALRTQQHMTQRELAEAAGVTVRSVINYEKNASTPTRRNLCQLAQMLGVTEAWLREPGSGTDAEGKEGRAETEQSGPG